MTILSLDVESRSTVDLKKTGAYVYWEHPDTDLWCACYAFGDDPVQTWLPGQPCPPAIAAHVASGGMISAWNAGFEKLAWAHRLGPTYGWPLPRAEQWEDTAAAAAAMALPRALGRAAAALGIAEQKDDEGYRLMMRMAKPRRATASGPTWWDDKARIDRLVAYCVKDVEAERALRKLLVPLSAAEREVWLFDQAMNDRGVMIDHTLVRALMQIADQALTRLDKEMAEATGWEVTACSQVSVLTAWLQAQGVDAAKLNKNAIDDLLKGELPEKARRAVELRKQAAKTSTAKLKAMRLASCRDGRVRGLHLYHGAGTGRWSGKLVQTQNMPRGTGTVKNPDSARAWMLRGEAEAVDFLYGPPMYAVSDMLRSCIIASPGHRLLAADYSSIEGRVTAWVAGEHDELAAYRANDAGTGAGIYEIAAGGIFNVDPFKVTKAQRQVGKAASLALGYGGGVLAFNSMANIYGIDMSPVYPILRETTEPGIMDGALARYEECLERGDTGTDVLTREAWIASEVTKALWRQKHPATVELWAGLETAAREAVIKPGAIATYGRISYLVRRGLLWCRLPSGRCLAYGGPRVEDRKTPWGGTKPSVTALGVNSVTKKWERFALYGGLATENCLSGMSEVLTDKGWRRMSTVDTSMRVWDGQEFVSHDGLVNQGERTTICLDGLWLTPEHKVLTNAGWKPAADTRHAEAAPPRTEFAWAEIRATDRNPLGRIERIEDALDDPVRLRFDRNPCGDGTPEGTDAELRLLANRGAADKSGDARDVEAPGLCRMAVDAGPLPSAVASSMAQLRGAGDSSVRTLAELRELLDGHGPDLSVRIDDRQDRQCGQLRARKLSLGSDACERTQQAIERRDRDAGGADAHVRSLGAHRDRGDNALVSGSSRLACGADVRPAELPQSRVEPVFDLLNCGPRHRFVARGGPGQPAFVVHNCVQAIARDLMANGMLKAEAAGYPIVMTVHDEAVADVPRGHGSLADYESRLCDLPAWAEGIPLVASGYEAQSYRKD